MNKYTVRVPVMFEVWVEGTDVDDAQSKIDEAFIAEAAGEVPRVFEIDYFRLETEFQYKVILERGRE